MENELFQIVLEPKKYEFHLSYFLARVSKSEKPHVKKNQVKLTRIAKMRIKKKGMSAQKPSRRQTKRARNAKEEETDRLARNLSATNTRKRKKGESSN